MLHDCCLFATLKHSSINSPLGIVYKNELSPYPLVVYPYSQKGILKRFIIQNRTNAREQVRIIHENKESNREFDHCSYYQRKNSSLWQFMLAKVYIFYIDEKC